MNCNFVSKKLWSDCQTVDLRTEKLNRQSRARKLYYLILKIDIFNLTDNLLNMLKKEQKDEISPVDLEKYPRFPMQIPDHPFSSRVAFPDGDHDDVMSLLSLPYF